MNNSSYKAFARLLGPAIFIVLIYRYGLQNILASLLETSPGWLFIGMLCMTGIILVRGARWFVLAQCHNLNLPFKTHLGISSYSIALGNLTPGNLGEFIKINELRKCGYGALTATTCSIMDRVMDLVYMSILATAGLTIIPVQLMQEKLSSLIGAGVICLVVLVTVVWVCRKRLTEISHKLVASIKGMNYTFVNISKANLLTIAHIVLLILMVKIASLALNLELSVSYIACFYFPVLLISVLPVTVAGIGTRDVLFVFFLGLAGISGDKAIALSTLIFFYRLFSAAVGYLIGCALKFNASS